MTSEVELDKHGFTIKEYPNELETLRLSLENCEELCGLDKKRVRILLDGEWSQSSTLDHSGRTSRKIVIEYDIKTKK